MRIGRAIAVFRGEHEFHIDFLGRRRLWFLGSGLLIALSAFGLLGPGLNLGIDFEGGSVLTYTNESGAPVADIQEALAEEGHDDAVVQLTGEDSVRIRSDALGEERGDLLEELADVSGVEASAINVEDVGPEWGRQISVKALQGLAIFLVAVTIYISFRFEWKMAVGAAASMFHDLLITAGVYALFGREVTPETVIALLTILGYSLYDTVVIFDKIKENASSPALVSRETYSGMVNLSLNQVFMRSMNTTLSTLLPVGTLLLFGGETLESFAFALFIGLLLGAYSSVFIAAPIVAFLKEREPKFADIRERVSRRDARPGLRPAVETAAVGSAPASKRELATATTATRPASSSQPARRKPKKKPRSKRKR